MKVFDKKEKRTQYDYLDFLMRLGKGKKTLVWCDNCQQFTAQQKSEDPLCFHCFKGGVYVKDILALDSGKDKKSNQD
jgi:hypothetical protein